MSHARKSSLLPQHTKQVEHEIWRSHLPHVVYRQWPKAWLFKLTVKSVRAWRSGMKLGGLYKSISDKPANVQHLPFWYNHSHPSRQEMFVNNSWCCSRLYHGPAAHFKVSILFLFSKSGSSRCKTPSKRRSRQITARHTAGTFETSLDNVNRDIWNEVIWNSCEWRSWYNAWLQGSCLPLCNPFSAR